MMSYAAAAQRNGFLLAVVHIVNRDWAELVRLYQRLGFIPEETDLQPIELALEKALPDVLNAEISELNFKNVVNKLGDIFYTFPFSLPPFYIAIIRCLGVLEGLAIQVRKKLELDLSLDPYGWKYLMKLIHVCFRWIPKLESLVRLTLTLPVVS